MKQDLIRPSSNGLDFLESYLTELFGERGSFRHNLERYYFSPEFKDACRFPTGVDDIPELAFETIQAQIEREAAFQRQCRHLLSLYAQRSQDRTISQADYYEIAGIMGLCPGHLEWHDTLFPHILDLFVSSDEEGQALWEHARQLPNIVEVMVTVMSDGLREGQIIDYYGRYIWSQGYARNFFRGENAYNGQSRPSLFRNLPADPTERILHKIIGNLRITEFALWMSQLDFIRQWPYGDIFHGAIAQHYGLPTNGIDVTSDLKTALFFACCRFENGHWRPLRPDEYACADARKNVAGRGGDSRYGVIFCAPADVANMSRCANIPDLHFTGVTPIGYQPFMRCSSQSGYIIEAGEPYDLCQDGSFSKYKFRHTPEICRWIFEEMDGGKKIYPNEMFGSCEDVIEPLKTSTTFSQQALDITLRHLGFEESEQVIGEQLAQRGIKIVSEVELCTKAKKLELEQTYWAEYKKHEYQTKPAPLRIRFSI